MAGETAQTFGGLLRRLRTAAGLTQEELAGAAEVSVRAVSDLERGVNLTARRETTRLLADGLGLSGTARAEFETAARQRPDGPMPRPSAGGGVVATKTLPRDTAAFTGREQELTQLKAVATAEDADGVVNICAIGGMAGIGKTTLAVHAAHRLASSFGDGQIFLRLHGHTPGQRPVDPSDALVSLLLIIGVAAEAIPPGLEARSALWRTRIAGRRFLLVLDDAVGHEQVQPLLPGSSGCLVIVTSRRHLTALEGARSVSLDVLPPDEAADLLVRLADRLDVEQGDGAVRDLARLCGYLPLAIGMLARQLHHHPAWTCGQIVANLAATRDRLQFLRTENVSVAAAFSLSYADLDMAQQRMFRSLGMHPGLDIDIYAAAALAGISPDAARHLLGSLYDQHLLSEPTYGRYRMHDLIAEHARDHAASDPAPDRHEAHLRLLDYYLHAVHAASSHLPRRPPSSMPPLPDRPPGHAPELATYEAAVTWMETERLNLHAAADHAAADALPRYTTGIAAAMHSFLRLRNYWDDAFRLHTLALAAARQAQDPHAIARAIADLGDAHYLLLDYQTARHTFEEALALFRDLGDRLGEASVLSSLGVVKNALGHYQQSVDDHERSVELYRDIGDRIGEATALDRLSWAMITIGNIGAAAACEQRALALYREEGYVSGIGNALAGLSAINHDSGDNNSALELLGQALPLLRKSGNRLGEANALTTLASIQHAMGDHDAALRALDSAMRLYHAFGTRGSRLGEANALRTLGKLRQSAGEHTNAAEALYKALNLYSDLGRRGDQAQVLNAMGDLALASQSPATAQPWFEQALAIAADIGLVAVKEAALDGLGRCARQEHDLRSATPSD